MNRHNRGRNLIANILIATGVILLLGVGSCLGWQRYRGQQLRSRLQQTPAAVALNSTPTVEPRGVIPTELPPTALPNPTVLPSPAATQPSSPTVASATATRSSEPTRPQPATTPTAASTQVPVSAPTNPATASALGPPVRIVIPDPAIKIDAPVVEMGWEVVQTADGPQSEWVIPKNEAGHHINSAQLGQVGNVVISGHNNLYGRVFEAISLAWPNEPSAIQRVDDFTERSDILNGRIVQLYNAAGQRFDFKITEFYRLKDTGVSSAQRIANARFMQPTDDARLTLVTCWPIWSNTHRLVVVAKPVNQP
jgi:sortase A